MSLPSFSISAFGLSFRLFLCKIDKVLESFFKPIFLFFIVLVATSSEAVGQAWKVDVLVVQTGLGHPFLGVLLELFSVHLIVLRGKHLSWYCYTLDLLFREQ